MNKNLEVILNKYEYRNLGKLHIDSQYWDAYQIKGYEHLYGKQNHFEPDYWVYFRGELVPFNPRDLSYYLWRLSFSESISSKHKWQEYSFNKIIKCKMFLNEQLTYSFTSRDWGYILSKAQSLQTELMEHPFSFHNPKQMDGTKIFYYDFPAIIKTRKDEEYGVQISIYPDSLTFNGSERNWWDLFIMNRLIFVDPNEKEWEKENWKEWREVGYINHGSPFSDSDIVWHR